MAGGINRATGSGWDGLARTWHSTGVRAADGGNGTVMRKVDNRWAQGGIGGGGGCRAWACSDLGQMTGVAGGIDRAQGNGTGTAVAEAAAGGTNGG
jgi:hypothetical protein